MSADIGVKWLPLESNPEVINKYVNNIGVETSKYEFVDIYGLDADLLAMVPKPVISVLLLFPVTKIYQEYRSKQIEMEKTQTQKLSPNLYFTKQTVQNACGTVALIHALANNRDALNINDEKAFGKYLKATETMDPALRAEYLKTDSSITSAHHDSATSGQSETPHIDEEVDLHFIAFVVKDGDLYELDGAKESPINHGSCSSDQLLERTCDIVKKLIELNPEEVRFNLIGLAAANSD